MNIRDLTEQVEQVSKFYIEKFGIKRTPEWFVLKLQEEIGELTQSYLMYSGQARQKGKSEEVIKEEFHKEVADAFCHILLLARANNIDLEKEVKEKWLHWVEEPAA